MARMMLVFLLSAATEEERGWRPLETSDSNAQVVSEYGDFPNERTSNSGARGDARTERSILKNRQNPERDRSRHRARKDLRTPDTSDEFDFEDPQKDDLVIHPSTRFSELESIDDAVDDNFSDDLSTEASYWDDLFDGELPERGKVKEWLQGIDGDEDFVAPRDSAQQNKSGLRRVGRDPMPLPSQNQRVRSIPDARDRVRNPNERRRLNRARNDRRELDQQDSEFFQFGRDGEIAQQDRTQRRRRETEMPSGLLNESELFDDDHFDETGNDLSLINAPQTASRESDYTRQGERTSRERRQDPGDVRRHIVNSPEKADSEASPSNDLDAANTDDGESKDSQTASEKTPFRINVETRWAWFLIVVVGLFFSVALNIYLKYIAWDIHNRYQEVVDDLNELESRQNTSISLEAAATDRYSSPSRRTAVRA